MGAGTSYRNLALEMQMSSLLSQQPKSLREYDSLPDRIRHARQSDSRSILVVEGPSDERLIARISKGSWCVYIAGSRNSVVNCIDEVFSARIPRVAGLVDRDFDDVLEECQKRNAPIYSFIEADLEAALVTQPIFDLMVHEFGTREKLAKNGGTSSLRNAAVSVAAIVGHVRHANAKNSWGIDFEKLDFSKKVDARNLTFAVDRFFNSVSALVPDADSRAAVRRLAADLDCITVTEDVKFRGRDALEVVRIGLQRLYGNSSISKAEDLARCLRLSAGEEFLEVEPFPEIQQVLGAI